MYGCLQVLIPLPKLKTYIKDLMLDNYSSSYERIREKSSKFSVDVKRKHKLCIEICKTLNNLNPSFMKEIFELRLISRPAREQYKLNLNIPKKRQVTFGTKSLESLGPKIWNNLPHHMKSAENLNIFKNLEWIGSSCSCSVCAHGLLKIRPYMSHFRGKN